MESRTSTIKVLFQRNVMSLAVKVLSSVEDLSIPINRWRKIGSHAIVNYFQFMVMEYVARGQGIPMENRVARKRWIQVGQRLSKKAEGMSVYIY
jgi:hypothetical protein